MIFRIFKDFFGFFCIFLDFICDSNPFKITKKIKIGFWHGPHVDATWHAGPRGSATRNRSAPTWRVLSIDILFNYHNYNGS